MVELLVLLCPPRSFSSVISTMIGQHPQMYGFPELHLFAADRLQEVMERERDAGKPLGPPGALRALAQLHAGTQSTEAVLAAHEWLDARRDWSSKQVMDYLLDQVERQHGVRVAVEKSPGITRDRKRLARLHAAYPNAYFLHLTRHPIANRDSLVELRDRKRRRWGAAAGAHEGDGDPVSLWMQAHSNVVDFAATLPAGQYMQIKGEDLLSEPDVYLPQIAEWLGQRADPDAIDAMKHPERSPYARPGPEVARGGNDRKFMRSPALRPGRVREPSLREQLRATGLGDALGREQAQALVRLAGILGYE